MVQITIPKRFINSKLLQGMKAYTYSNSSKSSSPLHNKYYDITDRLYSPNHKHHETSCFPFLAWLRMECEQVIEQSKVLSNGESARWSYLLHAEKIRKVRMCSTLWRPITERRRICPSAKWVRKALGHAWRPYKRLSVYYLPKTWYSRITVAGEFDMASRYVWFIKLIWNHSPTDSLTT